MKNLKLVFILFLLVFALINAQSKTSKSKTGVKTPQAEQSIPAPPPATDGVFIQLSSGFENPQKVLMALTMAVKMADDHEVYVYLDINAVNIVLSSAKSIELPKYEASKILISKLIDKNVTVAVCPTCLEVANHTKFELMKGITFASKDDFFSFTKGRILSFSY